MTGAREVRTRGQELSPKIGDLAHNTALIDAAIRSAAADGVELLVLPELSTSGYYLRDAEEARSVALHATDDRFRRWAELIRPGMVVVLGFCEQDGETIYNSAAVLTEAGLAYVYRKTHLWDDEKRVFTPGAVPPEPVDTPVGSLGVLICYDLEFPEMPRRLALKGTDVLAVPTNWPLVPRPDGERAPEVVQAMAAARSSGMAIVCSDRSGEERGGVWTEGTTIIGPDGWPVGSKDADGRVDAVIPFDPDRRAIGPRNHLLEDRRPELYGS
jgi:predicted amidohydrolase